MTSKEQVDKLLSNLKSIKETIGFDFYGKDNILVQAFTAFNRLSAAAFTLSGSFVSEIKFPIVSVVSQSDKSDNIRCDNGSKFISHKFQNLSKGNGDKILYTLNKS